MLPDVTLRPVLESDLPVFFEHQLDPDATRMAAFPSRGRGEFDAHWKRILADGKNVLRTIVFRGEVAGNVVSWEQAGARNVGYWLGKRFWGNGIASSALAQFLDVETSRPLLAHVAKHNIASIRVLQKCGFRVAGEGSNTGADGEDCEEYVMILDGKQDGGG